MTDLEKAVTKACEGEIERIVEAAAEKAADEARASVRQALAGQVARLHEFMDMRFDKREIVITLRQEDTP